MTELIEEVFFEEKDVKVTNLRIMYKHDTIAINKIALVDVNLRAVSMFTSIIVAILAILALCLNPYLDVLFIVLSFIWVSYEYDHYVELWLTIGTTKKRIAQTSVRDREHINRMSDAIGNAIISNEKLREQGFDETETMRVKRMVADLDNTK